MGFPEQDRFYRQWGQAGDAAKIYSMARKMVVQSAGTYSATEVLGYRVLIQGTGDWQIQGVDDASPVTVPFAAMLEGVQYAEHLKSITVGTGGSVILYIP